MLSFMVGFSFWSIWNGYSFLVGDYQFGGLNLGFFGMPLLEVLVGYLLGSLINDIIVRGYIINYFKDKISIPLVFTISVFLYALDDFWYAGFSLSIIIFSILLGMSLTFAFFKTGSIWANTGIHFGSNVAYGLPFGQLGKSNSSLIIVTKSGHESLFTPVVDYSIPILMFLFLLWAIRFYKLDSKFSINSLSTTLSR